MNSNTLSQGKYNYRNGDSYEGKLMIYQKVKYNLEWKMALVFINMQRQDKFIKENGKMIYGMVKDNINLLMDKLI